MRNLTISLLLLISIVAHAQNPQEKYALVIGVKSYTHVQPLANSLNDAKDLSATLKKKGFQVIELYDPKTKRDMQDAVRKYFTLLQGKDNVAGMVFYSGHGMQVDGQNYLIPATANPQIKADLDDQCLSMDYVMRAIEEAGNGLNIFVLDACRNNPFRSFSRSAEKGLTMVNAPRGSYIVYATKPGSVASDGTGRNGLFTSKLLQHINEEGLKFEEVFKRVAADVAKESGDAQRPWISSDYTGDFYFSGTTTKNTEPVVTKKEEPKLGPKTESKESKKSEVKKSATPVETVEEDDKITVAADNSAIVGVWENSQYAATLYLNEDGSGEFNGQMIKYSIAGNKFTMRNGLIKHVYTMVRNGNSMTFSGADLKQPLTFTKYSEGGSQQQQTSAYGIDNALVGQWTSNLESMEFKANGQCIYAGNAFPYTAIQNVITMSSQQGSTSFYYLVNGNNLTLTINGLQYYYTRVRK